MLPVRKNTLLKTSSANDVLCSNGILLITGLNPIEKKSIIGVFQRLAKTEVVQVATIGADLYTPTASTVYKVEIGDYNTHREGRLNGIRTYSYTTPPVLATIGATAALQREYINGKLIAKINADSSAKVTAATLTLGAGFTVTDDAGYYPAKRQGVADRKGASRVFAITNEDGTGFAVSNGSVTITTAAVYAVGQGTDLKAAAPVINAMDGNIITGYYDAPVTIANATADDGQKYNGFSIVSLVRVGTQNVTEQFAYQFSEQTIWVDNGTGTSTTNLTGYIAFEKRMHNLISELYRFDGNSLVEPFEDAMLILAPGGAVATGTDAAYNIIGTTWSRLTETIIGTSTAKVPALATGGVNLDLDATDTEGLELTPGLHDTCAQKFVVGKQAFSVFAKIQLADCTDAKVLVGFRKKAAYTADFNDYTDLAAIGFNADDITTWGILNNAATVATDTTVNGTDAAWVDLEIKVAIDGTVTAFYNGVSYPIYSAGTTTLILDASDEMIPFVRAVNAGGGDPDVIIKTLIAIPEASWRK